MNLLIELFPNVKSFDFEDFHQNIWVLEWNEKDEKVLDILCLLVAVF